MSRMSESACVEYVNRPSKSYSLLQVFRSAGPRSAKAGVARRFLAGIASASMVASALSVVAATPAQAAVTNVVWPGMTAIERSMAAEIVASGLVREDPPASYDKSVMPIGQLQAYSEGKVETIDGRPCYIDGRILAGLYNVTVIHRNVVWVTATNRYCKSGTASGGWHNKLGGGGAIDFGRIQYRLADGTLTAQIGLDLVDFNMTNGVSTTNARVEDFITQFLAGADPTGTHKAKFSIGQGNCRRGLSDYSGYDGIYDNLYWDGKGYLEHEDACTHQHLAYNGSDRTYPASGATYIAFDGSALPWNDPIPPDPRAWTDSDWTALGKALDLGDGPFTAASFGWTGDPHTSQSGTAGNINVKALQNRLNEIDAPGVGMIDKPVDGQWGKQTNEKIASVVANVCNRPARADADINGYYGNTTDRFYFDYVLASDLKYCMQGGDLAAPVGQWGETQWQELADRIGVTYLGTQFGRAAAPYDNDPNGAVIVGVEDENARALQAYLNDIDLDRAQIQPVNGKLDGRWGPVTTEKLLWVLKDLCAYQDYSDDILDGSYQVSPQEPVGFDFAMATQLESCIQSDAYPESNYYAFKPGPLSRVTVNSNWDNLNDGLAQTVTGRQNALDGKNAATIAQTAAQNAADAAGAATTIPDATSAVEAARLASVDAANAQTAAESGRDLAASGLGKVNEYAGYIGASATASQVAAAQQNSSDAATLAAQAKTARDAADSAYAEARAAEAALRTEDAASTAQTQAGLVTQAAADALAALNTSGGADVSAIAAARAVAVAAKTLTENAATEAAAQLQAATTAATQANTTAANGYVARAQAAASDATDAKTAAADAVSAIDGYLASATAEANAIAAAADVAAYAATAHDEAVLALAAIAQSNAALDASQIAEAAVEALTHAVAAEDAATAAAAANDDVVGYVADAGTARADQAAAEAAESLATADTWAGRARAGSDLLAADVSAAAWVQMADDARADAQQAAADAAATTDPTEASAFASAGATAASEADTYATNAADEAADAATAATTAGTPEATLIAARAQASAQAARLQATSASVAAQTSAVSSQRVIAEFERDQAAAAEQLAATENANTFAAPNAAEAMQAALRAEAAADAAQTHSANALAASGRAAAAAELLPNGAADAEVSRAAAAATAAQTSATSARTVADEAMSEAQRAVTAAEAEAARLAQEAATAAQDAANLAAVAADQAATAADSGTQADAASTALADAWDAADAAQVAADAADAAATASTVAATAAGTQTASLAAGQATLSAAAAQTSAANARVAAQGAAVAAAQAQAAAADAWARNAEDSRDAALLAASAAEAAVDVASAQQAVDDALGDQASAHSAASSAATAAAASQAAAALSGAPDVDPSAAAFATAAAASVTNANAAAQDADGYAAEAQAHLQAAQSSVQADAAWDAAVLAVAQRDETANSPIPLLHRGMLPLRRTRLRPPTRPQTPPR